MSEPSKDIWAEWLLKRRFGGEERKPTFLEGLRRWRGRVLKNASVREGDTLLAVGAGDGLIAFGALDLLAESGRVVFSDISQNLLDHSRKLAEEAGVSERCRFFKAPAEDLRGIEDESVNVVTTRSVLSLEEFLHTAGNPKIPTLEEAMHETLTLEKKKRFSEYLRPLVESGERKYPTAPAYLRAVKRKGEGSA